MSGALNHETSEKSWLLPAARRGDERAFLELVQPLRPGLQVLCYRMLGSVQDAEDVLQEVLLRAWRGLPSFEGRSSLRSWLYRIATNASLDAIERRPKRVLPVYPEDRPEGSREPVWIEPLPDDLLEMEDAAAAPGARYEQRESVELAFVAALQHLPGNQRAALILREVLGFSAHEVADTLQTTSTAVHSAVQHARRRMDERLPDRSQQVTLRSLGDRRLRQIVRRYAEALEHGDVEAMVAMLAEDATWSMPPTPRVFRGHDEIVEFLVREPFTLRWRHLPARANGQPALGWYRWNEQRGRFVAEVLEVLTLRGAQVAAVTAFIGGGIFPSFGLPDELC